MLVGLGCALLSKTLLKEVQSCNASYCQSNLVLKVMIPLTKLFELQCLVQLSTILTYHPRGASVKGGVTEDSVAGETLVGEDVSSFIEVNANVRFYLD